MFIFLIILNFCNSLNTIIQDNKCICKLGYITDDIEFKGCWKCEKKCHPKANCIYPGHCECKNGYYGDGIDICNNQRPIILNINPNFGSINGNTLINITVKYIIPNINHSIFCKFDENIVRGNCLNNLTIQCLSPPHNIGNINFFLSYDQIKWSNNNIIFFYKDLNQKKNYQKFYLILIFLIIFSYYLIKFKLFKTKKNFFFKKKINF